MSSISYVPTDENRALVVALSSEGIEQERIARILKIDKKTLYKYFREELDVGKEKANGEVVAVAYRMATNGRNPAMTIFWLKARCGWKEKLELEMSNSPLELLREKLNGD